MKTIFMAASISLFACLAEAVPTLYPSQFNFGLRNNTNSDLLADSENSGRYYVLPPNSSFARVTGLNAMTANTGFCRELANIQSYARETIEQVNQLKNKEIELVSKLADEQKKTDSAQKNLENFVNRNNLQSYDYFRSLITAKQSSIDDLKNKIAACRFFCSDLNIQLALALKELDQIIEDRRQTGERSSPDIIQNYTLLSQNLSDAEAKIMAAVAALRDLRHDLLDLYKDYIELFDAHSQREGGRVSISYESGWSENVRRLAGDNPRLSFEKVPTENAQIRADAYDKKNLIPHGSILGFEMGGQSVSSGANLGSYPENFSGSATLNLLAVCPMLHPEWFDLDLNREWTRPENIHFGLTVSYDYPSQFKYDLMVKYNMYKMYDLVKKQGTEGGFFNTKSWSTEEEKATYRDAFSAVWSAQSSQGDLSPEKKFDIESDLKKEMLTRLASQIVMTSSSNKLLPAPELPKAGAQAVSNSLRSQCGLNLLCHLGGVAMDLVYSVFSKTEISQSLRQEIDAAQEEHYVNNQVLMQTNLTSYW